MEKYDGMNKVEVVASPSQNICKKAKKHNFKLIIINTAVAVLLGLGVFCGKFLPIPGYDKFVGGIKQIVCFDLIDYISDKVAK